jgi:hypothetical protein
MKYYKFISFPILYYLTYFVNHHPYDEARAYFDQFLMVNFANLISGIKEFFLKIFECNHIFYFLNNLQRYQLQMYSFFLSKNYNVKRIINENKGESEKISWFL